MYEIQMSEEEIRAACEARASVGGLDPPFGRKRKARSSSIV
jgi:hypothetical protein